MFTLLKYLMRNANPLTTGGLIDDRKDEEKKDDIGLHDIVGSANVVNWTTKDPSTWRKFPDLNQYQSFTCGANALSKFWGIILFLKYGRYVQLSRGHIYQRRINKPNSGMAMYDMFNIGAQGATLEELTGENIKTDADADALKIDALETEVGKGFALSTPIYLNSDIDEIASVIQTTGKGVILLTCFNSGEWSKYVPTIIDATITAYSQTALRHFVVATDFTLYNGVKSLIIEDSALFGGFTRRVMTEDWVNSRVIDAGYTMTFKFGQTGSIPSYDGMTIVSAQRCMQYDGEFPLNVSFVENWGPVSRQSAAKFQSKYSLPKSGLLDDVTKIKLQQLYP